MKRFSPLIAALLIVSPYLYCRKAAANPPDPLKLRAEKFQRDSGLSADTFESLYRIQAKTIAGSPISEKEWNVIEAASHAERPPFRCMTLEYLAKYVGTPYEGRARELARRLALDPDPGTRSFALLELVSMKDERVRSLIEEAKRSDQPYVRETAGIAAKRLEQQVDRQQKPR